MLHHCVYEYTSTHRGDLTKGLELAIMKLGWKLQENSENRQLRELNFNLQAGMQPYSTLGNK